MISVSRCFSTHNNGFNFTPDNLIRARDMNLILGCKYVVWRTRNLDLGSMDGRKSPIR